MIKAIKRVIAGISAAAIVAGAAVGGWAIGVNSNRSDNTFDPANGGLIIDNSEGNGVSIVSTEISAEDYAEYGVNALADSASTLTATVTPADAINNTFTWTVAWQDSGDSWASGKSVNDYIQLSSSTSTSGQAITVTCLKDFGEQIVVTATNSEDSGLSASCVCEYQTRLLDVEYNLYPETGSYEVEASDGETYEVANTRYGTAEDTHSSIYLQNYDTGDSDWNNYLRIVISGHPVFSAGTIEYADNTTFESNDMLQCVNEYFTIPSIYEEYEQEEGSRDFESTTTKIYKATDGDDNVFTDWVCLTTFSITYNDLYYMFTGTYVGGSELTISQKNELYALFCDYEETYGSSAAFFCIEFQDPTGGNHTFYYDCTYNSLATRATGTNMSESTLVF